MKVLLCETLIFLLRFLSTTLKLKILSPAYYEHIPKQPCNVFTGLMQRLVASLVSLCDIHSLSSSVCYT